MQWEIHSTNICPIFDALVRREKKMDIFKSRNANIVGEYLREQFWPPKNENDFGCYSLFEYAPEAKELSKRIVNQYGQEYCEYNRAELNGVICEWYWEGDGVLRFILPGGKSLINPDCKTDCCWEWE